MTGEIIKVADRSVYTPTTGSGRVFDPDPLTRAGAFYQAGDNLAITVTTIRLTGSTDRLADLLDIEFITISTTWRTLCVHPGF